MAPRTGLLIVMEGVLADTIPADVRSLQAALEALGTQVLPGWLYARLRPTLLETIAECASALSLTTPTQVIHDAYSACFMSRIFLVQVNEKIVQMIRSTRPDTRLALISERPQAQFRAIVRLFTVLDYFTAVIAEEAKPEVDTRTVLLHRAADLLGITPTRCRVLAEKDWMIACTHAGMRLLEPSTSLAFRNRPRIGHWTRADLLERSRANLKAPTVRDVARQAGVSTATVSRVLNLPDIVAETTRTRVLEAIAKMDYVPDEFARRLGSKPSRSSH